MRMLCKTWRWFAKDPHQLIGVRILQISLGTMLLFQVVTSLPFAGYLWGPNSITDGSTSDLLGPTLGDVVDTVFTADTYIFCVLFILAIGALGLLFGYWTRIATFLTLISFSLLTIRLPELYNAGDTITQLVLIYMLFLLPHRAKFSTGQFRVWLHNIAVVAIILQLIVMYTASGFFKSIGPLWQQGTAMYYISQTQLYSLPGASKLFSIPLIVYVATYVPMAYQLLFPVAIISRLKLPWIALGILFHLGIAVLMGLVTFSTVMIGLELFLISDQEYAMIRKRGGLICKRLSRAGVRIVQKQTRARATEAEEEEEEEESTTTVG